jgi:hypothetical protein
MVGIDTVPISSGFGIDGGSSACVPGIVEWSMLSSTGDQKMSLFILWQDALHVVGTGRWKVRAGMTVLGKEQ